MVDPALAPYMASFEVNIGVSTAGISANFVPLTLPTLGQCVAYPNGDRVIQIDPTYWGNINDDQREQILYHECGHCAMSLGHTPGYISGGPMDECPISIMNPDVFGLLIGCYTDNKEYYYQELRSL